MIGKQINRMVIFSVEGNYFFSFFQLKCVIIRDQASAKNSGKPKSSGFQIVTAPEITIRKCQGKH